MEVSEANSTHTVPTCGAGVGSLGVGSGVCLAIMAAVGRAEKFIFLRLFFGEKRGIC